MITSSEESDMDEADLDDSLPFLGGDEHFAKPSEKTKTDYEYLVSAELSDQHQSDQLEKLDKEITLFNYEDDDVPAPKIQVPDVEQRQIELHPPGIVFFSTDRCRLYTEDTLVWPFADSFTNPLGSLSLDKVKVYIKEGLFQRVYSSKGTTKLMMKYLFHLCCCTTDMELLYPTYNTLCYIAENNECHLNVCQELYLALANLGADMKKYGKDPSLIKSPVLPPCPAVNPPEQPVSTKKNLSLMLQFLGVLLTHSRKCSDDDLDELMKIFVAIGLDPTVINTGLDLQVATCISRTLSLYPSQQVFFQRVQGLVEDIITYCDCNHHTVSHVCTMYIQPTCLGQILCKSIAFLQVELSLQAKDKNSLDLVEIDDVVELIESQLEVMSAEEDGYLLHSVMKLLVCCVGDGPFTPTQKKSLRHMCDLLNPVIISKRVKVDDMYSSLFRFYSRKVIDKWKCQAGTTGRQQTLHEMQTSSLSREENDPSPDISR
ncbi:uncharacterized protein LOC125048241 isoform X2 [Penaeus chinensis]|uniref:uncharacterized protein LOC125048241 isoform X2 n=1 Tax=Penaeus chinensis TaxID=139456 RepID=UPI001FB6F262|nr:uncharacterized protein LOC125048241 isoform X2 [Penaeus chinensis]